MSDQLSERMIFLSLDATDQRLVFKLDADYRQEPEGWVGSFATLGVSTTAETLDAAKERRWRTWSSLTWISSPAWTSAAAWSAPAEPPQGGTSGRSKNMPSQEFVKLAFRGGRFDEGELTLDVFRDLLALKAMVVEVAKWHFLQHNTDRRRAPSDFANGFDFKLMRMEMGSCVSVLGLSPSKPDVPSRFQDYFGEALDTIMHVIDSADQEQNLGTVNVPVQEHPMEGLSHFRQFGKNLNEQESLSFDHLAQNNEVTLTPKKRRAIISRFGLETQPFDHTAILRGSIPAADQEKMTFEFVPIYGPKVTGKIPPEHAEAVISAFVGYPEGVKVSIEGRLCYNSRGVLRTMDRIEDISPLDSLDVPAQLESMKNLPMGWATGMQFAGTPDPTYGIPPSHEDLDRLASVFTVNLSDRIPNPYAYPTPEGGIQLEWSIGPYESSLEIDFSNGTGEWHVLNMVTKDSVLEDIQLDAEGWEWIADKIQQQESSE